MNGPHLMDQVVERCGREPAELGVVDDLATKRRRLGVDMIPNAWANSFSPWLDLSSFPLVSSTVATIGILPRRAMSSP